MNGVNSSPDWQAWLEENIRRGCRREDMLASMLAAGVLEATARQAIGFATPPNARLPTLAWPSGTLHTADHPVTVLTAMRQPNIVVLQNVLTAAECDLIIALSTPKLEPSKVVSNVDGASVLDPVRSSFGTYFVRGQVPELRAIEDRLAALTGMPVAHGEGLQVLRYGIGGQYVPHFDFFPPEVAGSAAHVVPERGGQRVATLIAYLNTVAGGGETIFPDVGCKVSAIKGNAVYFSYLNAQGELDRKTLHGGNPVEAGEKWIATWWMRQGVYA